MPILIPMMTRSSYALAEYPLELVPQAPFHVGNCGLEGSPGLTPEQLRLVQRFEPAGNVAPGGGGMGGVDSCRVSADTMGFFIAKFTKTTSYQDDFK
jgi:hypothetical protein